jgi:hypothetical protein
MPPYRIEWLDETKTDVRALDLPTGMRIFGIRQRSRLTSDGRGADSRRRRKSPRSG